MCQIDTKLSFGPISPPIYILGQPLMRFEQNFLCVHHLVHYCTPCEWAQVKEWLCEPQGGEMRFGVEYEHCEMCTATSELTGQAKEKADAQEEYHQKKPQSWKEYKSLYLVSLCRRQRPPRDAFSKRISEVRMNFRSTWAISVVTSLKYFCFHGIQLNIGDEKVDWPGIGLSRIREICNGTEYSNISCLKKHFLLDNLWSD